MSDLRQTYTNVTSGNTWFSCLSWEMDCFYCICLFTAEFGDYDEDEHGGSADYVSRCKMLPKQADGQLVIIADVHRSLRYVSRRQRYKPSYLLSRNIIGRNSLI